MTPRRRHLGQIWSRIWPKYCGKSCQVKNVFSPFHLHLFRNRFCLKQSQALLYISSHNFQILYFLHEANCYVVLFVRFPMEPFFKIHHFELDKFN